MRWRDLSRQLAQLLDQLCPGDVIAVTKYNRLARSLCDLLEIVEASKARGGCSRSLFDPADRAQSGDDIDYIYSTFPIVERQEQAAHDRYLSRDLCLAYCDTLAAGRPAAEPEL